ncbi:helix-turn-helix transcriptional regulator [Pseudonocardia xinjiangensis]|uniref:HTH luxR-type domain-containing protein n=1 Tax=Pseudonocardia xinjiangensis TaxID=75289 RepID=A0ABX1RGN9_9PSEU|nr:helix-turn-helix transcriptional regulator [Pseudonocardia xinjiangensis]NMH79558.1 hypothetical protein [Pseudonocardia xinjiangensis]
MIEARGFDVGPAVVAEVVARTGGNPAAVLATVRGLATARPGTGLPVRLGAASERAWATVLDEIPGRTTQALAVVVTSASARLAEIEPVLGALGLSLADIEPAERAGLVERCPDGLRPTDPLLATAVLSRVPLATHRLILRTFADHADEPVRCEYQAATRTVPDDDVASALAAAARSADRRCDHLVAARLWTRSADLSVDDADRADRLVTAARAAQLGGNAARALAQCDEAAALRPDPALRSTAAPVRARVLGVLGYPDRALEVLVAASCAADDRQAAHIAAEAFLPSRQTGRTADLLRLLGRRRPRGVALAAADRTPAARLLALRGATTEAPDPWAVHHMIVLGLDLIDIEDLHGARAVLDEAGVLARGRDPSSASLALAARAELGWWTGDWGRAVADGEAAVARAEALGQPGPLARALVGLARISAARGRGGPAGDRLRRARESAGAGQAAFLDHVASVEGFAALTVGDHTTAIEVLTRPGEADAAATGDLAEAYIRSGAPAAAAEPLRTLDRMASTTSRNHPAWAAARCRILLAGDVDEVAAQRSRWDRWLSGLPFERARVLLCAAETLRRLRRPAAARPLLREAVAVFEALGATPWADRARGELAASGDRRPAPGGRSALGLLTPQEEQVARSVAAGLTNPEVAAALFLSRKTVEAHLTRVYRKLGVRSRVALSRQMRSREG